MNKNIIIYPILFLVFSFTSCSRIKNKAENTLDNIFPHFDHQKPDTDANKKRFRDFIRVQITDDVKNIYCFDDAIGIDASYWFTFNCSPTTSEKIIEKNKFQIDTINPNSSYACKYDFDWWNNEKVAKLQQYRWTDGDRYFKFYWYDIEEEKAYYYDFDL